MLHLRDAAPPLIPCGGAVDSDADSMLVDHVALPLVAMGPIAVAADVTARDRAFQRLRQTADHDAFTGALTRRAFDTECERALLGLATARRPVAVPIADIDDFEAVNDAHGHAVGDRVLRCFGAVVTAGLRDSDIFGRIGGDEFGPTGPSTPPRPPAGTAWSWRRPLRSGESILLVWRDYVLPLRKRPVWGTPEEVAVRYLLLIHQGNALDDWDGLTADEQKDIAAAYKEISTTPGVTPGRRLQPPETATTVRVKDGATLITDGPFAETKDAIGGWLVYETDDLDSAIALAARVPATRFGGAVEVRPLV